MREVGYMSTKLHFTNSWVHKPLSILLCQSMWEKHSESAHGHCLVGFVFKCATHAFAVLLLAVIKQRCITAGAPFWIGGELPVFVVRPHAPNRDVRTVTVLYEYMYHATPNIYMYVCVSVCVYMCMCVYIYIFWGAKQEIIIWKCKCNVNLNI